MNNNTGKIKNNIYNDIYHPPLHLKTNFKEKYVIISHLGEN